MLLTNFKQSLIMPWPYLGALHDDMKVLLDSSGICPYNAMQVFEFLELLSLQDPLDF